MYNIYNYIIIIPMLEQEIGVLDNFGSAIRDRDLLGWIFLQTKDSIHGAINPPTDCYDFWNNWPTYMVVPWILCTNGAVSRLATELKKYGNVAYAPKFPFCGMWDMNHASKLLHHKIWDVLDHHETNGDIRLIWHSLGWIIAAKSLDEDINTEWLRINNLATAATPWQWAPLSKPMFFSKAARQLNIPKGFPISNIDDRVTTWGNYISEEDTGVPPEYQRLTQWFSSIAQEVWMEGFTHTDFINGPKLESFVRLLEGTNQ